MVHRPIYEIDSKPSSHTWQVGICLPCNLGWASSRLGGKKRGRLKAVLRGGNLHTGADQSRGVRDCFVKHRFIGGDLAGAGVGVALGSRGSETLAWGEVGGAGEVEMAGKVGFARCSSWRVPAVSSTVVIAVLSYEVCLV